jgi:hypothetical protein
MSEPDELEPLICQVCGKNESVGVACSAFGAVSLAYCAECIHEDRDSYGLLVGTAACFPVPPDKLELTSFREDLWPTVEATMAFRGKTWDDLRQESKELLDEMAALDEEVHE